MSEVLNLNSVAPYILSFTCGACSFASYRTLGLRSQWGLEVGKVQHVQILNIYFDNIVREFIFLENIIIAKF